MKKITNTISFYWALQLLSTALLYNLAQGGLCQARGIEESNPNPVKLELMTTTLPNDSIAIAVTHSSATTKKINPAQYDLVVIERFLGSERDRQVPQTQRRRIPLASLLGKEELRGGETCVITFSSNARKVIARSPKTHTYTLTCLIVDKQRQRGSNEIKKTVASRGLIAPRFNVLLSLGEIFLIYYGSFLVRLCVPIYLASYRDGSQKPSNMRGSPNFMKQLCEVTYHFSYRDPFKKRFDIFSNSSKMSLQKMYNKFKSKDLKSLITVSQENTFNVDPITFFFMQKAAEIGLRRGVEVNNNLLFESYKKALRRERRN